MISRNSRKCARTVTENVIRKALRGKTLLLIGGAGSLGTALIGQLLKYPCKTIRVLDNSEKALFSLRQRYESSELRMLLGDVRNQDRLSMAMMGVDYVVLCAAVKSVDIADQNVLETIDVNVNGTLAVIRECYRSKPMKVIALSSDKSILEEPPVSVYHASKFLMEEAIEWANRHSDAARFSCIRPANFVPSDMSVFQSWLEHYKRGRPIPVTHRLVKRFFIPIDAAAHYVLLSLAIMQGGEVFIPPAREFRLLDLAEKLRTGIQIVGLRPTDRLTERLMSKEEEERAKKRYGMWILDTH